ncbi:MAG TPA: LysR family transcriptional regulator [Polyangiaceae bacterium]|nr:LysR family transcriptional regulator [Polyangiaceae bacterium]
MRVAYDGPVRPGDEVEVRSLRVFVAVLEARHVGRAALALDLGQPAVSYHLRRLREAFGDPLFVRDGRGVRPTPRALALAPRARAVLHAVGELSAPDAFDPRSVRREVRVASLDYERVVVLARAVAAIHREAPGCRVALVPRSPRDLDALADGTLDALVGPALEGGVPGSYRRRLLYRERITCVVRRGHPLARRRGAPSLDEYVAHPHVSVIVNDTGGNPVDAFLARRGRARHAMARVAGFEAVCAVVEQTDGVALLPASLSARARALGLCVLPSPLEPKTFGVYLFWHESVHADPLHAWLRATIADAAPGAAPSPPLAGDAPAPKAPRRRPVR